MKRCLELAAKGFGQVSPNPMVGCVVVQENQIIGEGYHAFFGGPHAEVNAIASVKNPTLLKDSTVYVSLEPCAHFGKTPPCADLLIRSGVKEVVIGMKDPNPLVKGKGIEKLNQAGIKTSIGILASEGKELNKRFLTSFEKNRPFVILKWAESADGFMGSSHRIQISGVAAQKRLHQWRSEEDAFMVGTNTLLIDDPALNNRLTGGKNPIRIAIDFELKSLGKPLKFYDTSQKTIVLNTIKNEQSGLIEFVKIDTKNPKEILDVLFKKGIQSLVVEGGAKLINSFIESGLFDEVRQFVSKKLILQSGIKSPVINRKIKFTEDLGDDFLTVY